MALLDLHEAERNVVFPYALKYTFPFHLTAIPVCLELKEDDDISQIFKMGKLS